MAREMIAYLELFEGKVSLTEILTLDYSLLIEMVKVKNQIIEQKNKEMKVQKEMMDAKFNKK